MKTLIFNGSPRKNGDTMTLINEFIKHLDGEYKIIDAYNCNIMPCIDCRYCWKNKGCCHNDEMQQVYDYIQECDNIIIASPLYFSQLTGQLLAITSRFQTYYSARFFRKEVPIAKSKRGGVILVGGGDRNFEGAYNMACSLLHHMNSKTINPAIYTYNTNNIPSKDNNIAMKGVKNLALLFNKHT
ncbi:Iron-sulfur flavoprotein [Sporomusa ovata DSM 2662]|uniref:Iron-sulfur flavoprotein n=1 Tax=Sporomusa ovata TaxID=2378 RepID=A0A0U1L1G3_9FIRM|nr:NAD(P)H-dependent oxidoreductase [Sporomusa ovata]EQB24575.1 NADPH-dependent FMN reductase [Sporomusa ovata DSM 2662]CQR73517.1 Iron-sulfur flavoprotein [Sporomusa ovata]